MKLATAWPACEHQQSLNNRREVGYVSTKHRYIPASLRALWLPNAVGPHGPKRAPGRKQKQGQACPLKSEGRVNCWISLPFTVPVVLVPYHSILLLSKTDKSLHWYPYFPSFDRERLTSESGQGGAIGSSLVGTLHIFFLQGSSRLHVHYSSLSIRSVLLGISWRPTKNLFNYHISVTSTKAFWVVLHHTHSPSHLAAQLFGVDFSILIHAHILITEIKINGCGHAANFFKSASRNFDGYSIQLDVDSIRLKRSCLIVRRSVTRNCIIKQYRTRWSRSHYTTILSRFQDSTIDSAFHGGLHAVIVPITVWLITWYVNVFHQRNPKHYEATPPLEPFRSYASIGLKNVQEDHRSEESREGRLPSLRSGGWSWLCYGCYGHNPLIHNATLLLASASCEQCSKTSHPLVLVGLIRIHSIDRSNPFRTLKSKPRFNQVPGCGSLLSAPHPHWARPPTAALQTKGYSKRRQLDSPDIFQTHRHTRRSVAPLKCFMGLYESCSVQNTCLECNHSSWPH